MPDKPLRLLRLPDVLDRFTLSRSALFAAVAIGEFPAAVRMTKQSVAWFEHEIDAWLLSRVREHAPGPTRGRPPKMK